jgi:4-hydroxy-tetrahydrodipicolinate synthase
MLNNQIKELHEMMFIEPNPIPVKWALSYLGLISGTLRLPMVQMNKIYEPKLAKLLDSLK